VTEDPFEKFGHWLDDAVRSGIDLPNAMTLATATEDAVPSARTVLLKGFDAGGFVFFTNYTSRKARELEVNPRAALVFYWRELDRQVCIRGAVAKVTAQESDEYFATRPLGSRLGAWASHQSQSIESREVLLASYQRMQERFPGDDIPRPEFWGGFRLTPAAIEFWTGQPDRMHNRELYERTHDGWNVRLLSP
jgi:pyridoxamine 5'-phosphate oxidase